ncbi:MAG: RNA polymerase sigma factor [Ardenticatenaceae bacterium]
MDEKQAIARLKEGDINGLEALVRAYQVKAIRAAYLITHERHLAEDIVQAAFIRAYEKIGQFDSSRPFAPWFLRIVTNDAVKAAVRNSRHVSFERQNEDEQSQLIRSTSDAPHSPEDLLERDETRRNVWEALQKLPPAQRAVIVCRYYLELKEAEIGEQTGRAIGTVKWLLHTARARLRTLLTSMY